MNRVNSDLAYDFVRQRILSGEYPPGRTLMTRELAAEIGVSRTPVRDALRQLEADGLVVIQAHAGTCVKTMDAREFRDTCGLRLALETYAAGLAAENCTVADGQEIRFALDNMRRITNEIIRVADEKPLLPMLREEDVRFHLAILKAAKNELVMSEILRLHLINRVVCGATLSVLPSTDKAVSDENRRKVLASHEEIYEAIVNRDVAGAKAAMERHVQDIVEKKLSALARTDGGLIGRKLTDAELAYES